MALISIITVTFNAENTIERCISSVKAQQIEYEHIIIDACSTDKTLDIIQANMHPFLRYVSEPDTGIYDGMNKGVAISNGDYIHFLNSDDEYQSGSSLKSLANLFDDEYDLIVSGIDMINDGVVKRRWRPTKPSRFSLSRYWAPPHPGLIINAKLFVNIGNFDENFKISGDFEWFRRVERNVTQLNMIFTNLQLVTMHLGGLSTKIGRNTIVMFFEDIVAISLNNSSIFLSSLYAIIKRTSKLSQFFSR